MRTIRLDDLDDPILQHALLRYQATHPRLDAGNITEADVRAALDELRPVINNATALAAETRAAIDAALATPEGSRF